MIGSTTNTFFEESSGTEGSFAYYAVSALDSSGESSTSRGVRAAPGVILDNTAPGGMAPGVTVTGTWLSSGVAGSHGVASVYASQTNGPTPTATYTFTPNLPSRGGYDIYLRWTAGSNRATNTPVDIVLSDETRTFTVNQTLQGGQWNYLTTVPADSGASMNVVLRNNGASGFIVADGVQFVPRSAPWTPGPEGHEYMVTVIDEHFDDTAIDPARWRQFLDRPHFSVSGGKLRLRTVWAGSTPLAQATSQELGDDRNWQEGGIVSRHSQKFGYHEARFRIPPASARGVDTAYWHTPSDAVLNGFEIDAPEFFNYRTTHGRNSFGFGIWDHYPPTPTRLVPTRPGRTWEYEAENSTLGDMSGYVTVGLEWRTDNSQAIYVNGKKLAEVPVSGMNDVESILPTSVILSTKVLNWMLNWSGPTTALDGAEALWDYVRYFQKPGWLGTASADWRDPANWGPDGVPGPGVAAVFNMPVPQAEVEIATDQKLASLSLDGTDLPALTFAGAGRLVLGERPPQDTTLTHGGILLNSAVAASQSFNVPVLGRRHLQIANVSRVPGVTLRLNNLVSGEGPEPCDVDFVSSTATDVTRGAIELGQPLGPGLRHVNRAGDTPFTLPANSQHSGELRLARGTVNIPEPSSLGTDPAAAIVFRPNAKHSNPWRPRLIYLGPAATIARPIIIGGRQADAVIEANGSGPLTLTGPVQFAPFAGDQKTVLTRDGRLVLHAGAPAATENVLASPLDDRSVVVEYLNSDNSVNTGTATLTLTKSGPGTWVLAGDNHLAEPLSITAGRLVVGQGTNGSLNLRTSPRTGAAPAVTISSGAEIVFGRDDTASFDTPIRGSGGLRKRGAGLLALNGSHLFTGPVTVQTGTLQLDGALTGTGTITVDPGATLIGTGQAARSANIDGIIQLSPLALASNLNLRATSIVRAAFAANAEPSTGPVTSAALAISNGARVDITLNQPGSSTDLRDAYWSTSRVFPLLSTTARSGSSLTVGDVSADSAGNPVSAFGTFSLEHTSTGVHLVWTPATDQPDDEPTVELLSPAGNLANLHDTQHHLHLTLADTGGLSEPPVWSVISGPGQVNFSSPDPPETIASFSAKGTYVLRVTASTPLGTATRDITVNVAPARQLVLQEGDGGVHAATYIRGDSPSWNSGARDQVLVGRNNAPFRALLAFDLATVPPGSKVTAGVELTVAGTGTGSAVGPLEIRRLLQDFSEGTGNGLSATNGTGTGADWNHRIPGTSWSAAGASSASDREPEFLQEHPPFNPSASGITGSVIRFANSASLANAVAQARVDDQPLRLLLTASGDESASSDGRFVRFASDDHVQKPWRPRLTLDLEHDYAPAITTGPAPTAFALYPSPLAGSATEATSVQWCVVDGPGTATFSDPHSAASAVEFSAPGNYLLRLTARGEGASTSRLLSVNVLTAHEGWRQAWFGSTSAVGDAADDADPDGDGLNNLLEFAFGGNPLAGEASPIRTGWESGRFHLDYLRPTVSSGLVRTPEWAESPGGPWHTEGIHTEVLGREPEGERIRSSIPTGSFRQRFMRINVSQP